jgi:tetratricopeptide (TPR) repeat protein
MAYGFNVLKTASIILACSMVFLLRLRADGFSFTNSLALAALAEKSGNIQAMLNIYDKAERLESSNTTSLCILSRCYCDLTHLTNSTEVQKVFLRKALACALLATKNDDKSAVAHACVAVCYAKSCALYDIKTKLVYSRLFKMEAEKAIALDPKQDIAYYLLGRWNYGVANLGVLSRTYVQVVYGGLPKASNEDAIRYYTKAIELAPARIIYHADLALAYGQTGQMKFEKAELKKCSELNPTDQEDRDAKKEAKRKLIALQ